MARLELAVCFDAGVPAVRRRGGRPPRWLPLNLHFTNVYARQSLGSQIHEKHEPEPPPPHPVFSIFINVMARQGAQSPTHKKCEPEPASATRISVFSIFINVMARGWSPRPDEDSNE